ncbi:hypothetical protein PZ897_12450 [Hoeflea sp. YIM 152468]|uniref:hypothetical protein n=1 Tax=Hoeflea sp. YIM 152468 TaxID=3031759 RepID=UPI0023DA8257|nr:hypothetical protein [Hoeflea sp. YIM 152468]MDF1608988.1 hypothetical protein [Hoeflea sp. YIM 152468]
MAIPLARDKAADPDRVSALPGSGCGRMLRGQRSRSTVLRALIAGEDPGVAAIEPGLAAQKEAQRRAGPA